MEIILRDDQRLLKSGVEADWAIGHRNVLAVLPTGGGKSVVVSDLAKDGAAVGMAQAIVAHRNELVSQMSIHIANRGIAHRIVGSDATIAQITRLHRETYNGQSFINPSALTGVVGVDTLLHRRESLADWAHKIDRFYIDEAHHVLKTNKWGKAVELFDRAHGLGVTASPERPDGMGLGFDNDGVFNSMVIGPTMRELINLGALCDYKIVCPQSDFIMNESDVGASGEFSQKKVKEKADKSHIVGDVVDAYRRYAMGKQAICFAPDVENGAKIAARFNEAGIRAAFLCGETPLPVREKFVKEFKAGVLAVLVNVDLFDEGFDVPACEVVIMARPTASLVKFLQQFGRALRTAFGKEYGLIIDHVSNVKRHKLPDRQRWWDLERREKRGKKEKDPDDLELATCKSCSQPYEPYLAACPHCGAVPPLPTVRERNIDMVEGDLMLLDFDVLNKMRQLTVLESPGSVGARVAQAIGGTLAKASINKQLEKIAAQERVSGAIAQWAAIERLKGLHDNEIHRKFYLTTGVDVLGALSAHNDREDFEKIATRIEGWYK
jgi:DNA repair protein RadD